MSADTTEDEVAAAVPAVMLDVAFSPVLETSASKEPTEVTQDDVGGYRLTYPNAMFPDATVYEPVTEEALKIMRARFLVTRGHHYRRLPAMSSHERDRVLRAFFGGAVWTPVDGSALARLMGMEPESDEVILGRVLRGELRR